MLVKTVTSVNITRHIFEKVFVDITGPLQSCQGYQYILALIDGFSKFVKQVPLRDMLSETVCKEIERNWIVIFGAPLQLHSDQGRNFISEKMKQMCEKCARIEIF